MTTKQTDARTFFSSAMPDLEMAATLYGPSAVEQLDALEKDARRYRLCYLLLQDGKLTLSTLSRYGGEVLDGIIDDAIQLHLQERTT